MHGHEDCFKREHDISAAWAKAEDEIRALKTQVALYREVLQGIATLAIEFSNCDQEHCPANSMQRDAQRVLADQKPDDKPIPICKSCGSVDIGKMEG